MKVSLNHVGDSVRSFNKGLATLLQYVDTVMVGQLGEQATASVSITTNVTWLVNSVSGAVGTAVLVLISKASWEEDENQIKKLSQKL